jgi:hypothetical protein
MREYLATQGILHFHRLITAPQFLLNVCQCQIGGQYATLADERKVQCVIDKLSTDEVGQTLDAERAAGSNVMLANCRQTGFVMWHQSYLDHVLVQLNSDRLVENVVGWCEHVAPLELYFL